MWAKAASGTSVKAAFTMVLRRENLRVIPGEALEMLIRTCAPGAWQADTAIYKARREKARVCEQEPLSEPRCLH